MVLLSSSWKVTNVARWWFYQHGRLCAKHPNVAAIVGVLAVLTSTLGLFTPRGQPFVFLFESMWQEFLFWLHHYAIPRWHVGAYLALALYIAVAADNGVKYSTLQQTFGLKHNSPRSFKSAAKRMTPRWRPPFMARFIVGLCGVLTIMFAIVISVAFSHSVIGVGMGNVFDELPLLIVYVGVEGVFSLLDASTATYVQSEKRDVGQVYFVDRVNQIAMATSLTGPEDFLIGVLKAGVALIPFVPVLLEPLDYWIGKGYSQAAAEFLVHAGGAVLAKLLLQMSVFASIVQALVPFWDPSHETPAPALTPDAKCRVCLETGPDLRRCPCNCTGSVGFIHPACFQQWFETKKSLRCELCHVIFQVRMLPTSVLTNVHTVESYMAALLPALLRRLVLYNTLMCALMCNKLGLIVFDVLETYVKALLGLPEGRLLTGATIVCVCTPAILAACAQVLPKVTIDWYRRHRVMHWDVPKDDVLSLDGCDDLGVAQSPSKYNLRKRSNRTGSVAAVVRAAEGLVKGVGTWGKARGCGREGAGEGGERREKSKEQWESSSTARRRESGGEKLTPRRAASCCGSSEVQGAAVGGGR